jgi:hypothetical protein
MGLFTSNSTFASISQDLISFINLVVGVLSVLALVIFLWGMVRYIYHSDDAESKAEGRSSIMWGLIALFVLFSIFGIIQILNVAFFGGAVNAGNVGGTAGNLPAIH